MVVIVVCTFYAREKKHKKSNYYSFERLASQQVEGPDEPPSPITSPPASPAASPKRTSNRCKWIPLACLSCLEFTIWKTLTNCNSLFAAHYTLVFLADDVSVDATYRLDMMESPAVRVSKGQNATTWRRIPGKRFPISPWAVPMWQLPC